MFINIDLRPNHDKKNSSKLLIIGIILLSVGLNCLINKRHQGIVIFSWGLSIATLYCLWLSIQELKELKRYAEKSIINKYRLISLILLVTSIVLIVCPIYIYKPLSIIFGLYIIAREVMYYINDKYGYTRYFGFWNIIKIISGAILILSPLFFISFLVGIFSFIAMLFGKYFICLAINNRDFY